MVIQKLKSLGFEVFNFYCKFHLKSTFNYIFLLSISVSDSNVVARNTTRTILKFDNELHGVNKYICEAKNKHGLAKVSITVLIPGVYKN